MTQYVANQLSSDVLKLSAHGTGHADYLIDCLDCPAA